MRPVGPVQVGEGGREVRVPSDAVSGPLWSPSVRNSWETHFPQRLLLLKSSIRSADTTEESETRGEPEVSQDPAHKAGPQDDRVGTRHQSTCRPGSLALGTMSHTGCHTWDSDRGMKMCPNHRSDRN